MKEILNSSHIIQFDGGIGTELYAKGFYINRPFEELSIQAPREVMELHKQYIDAGTDIITTNTFSITRPQLKKFDIEGNQAELLRAALKIAHEARAGTSVRVGLSIGPLGVLVEPLGPTGLDEAQNEFARVADIVKDDPSMDLYLLETFSSLSELGAAVRGIRSIDKDRPIFASITARSNEETVLKNFARLIGGDDQVQALGFNCCEGPSDVLSIMKKFAPITNKPIFVRPNAGMPRNVNGRYFYMTSPDYMGKYSRRFVEAGAVGVGGCCGTGPDHIRAMQSALRMINAQRQTVANPVIEAVSSSHSQPRAWDQRKESHLGQWIAQKRKPISIELLPPKGVFIEGFLEQVVAVENAGIPFINIPDGSRASTRVSSLHLCAFVNNRVGGKIKAIPHFTPRDRNLISLQADLLGAYVNGVRDILLITGDPPKLGTNRDATAVYDIDSIGLTHLATCLNNGVAPNGDKLGSHTSFGIGVASNPTAVNLELEQSRWKYKVESGADYAVTQPIFEPESYLRWRDSISNTYRPHLIGIWPLVSLRNAEFMANEVPGIVVPKWAIEEMAKSGDNRAEAQKRGIEISEKIMRHLESECAGFCVSAPLGRVEVALAVAKGFH